MVKRPRLLIAILCHAHTTPRKALTIRPMAAARDLVRGVGMRAAENERPSGSELCLLVRAAISGAEQRYYDDDHGQSRRDPGEQREEEDR